MLQIFAWVGLIVVIPTGLLLVVMFWIGAINHMRGKVE